MDIFTELGDFINKIPKDETKERMKMKEVLILEDKSETRKVLAGLVKEVRSDAVIYEAADEKTAYDIAMKRTIDLFLVDIILHPQQHDPVGNLLRI